MLLVSLKEASIKMMKIVLGGDLVHHEIWLKELSLYVLLFEIVFSYYI